MNTFYKTITLGLCGLMFSSAALASSVPPTVAPGRGGDAPRPQPFIEDALPNDQSDIPSPSGDALTGQHTFLLKGVAVSGNTAISDEDLRPIYAPYLGQSIPILTLNHIAKQITQFYRQKGYFLSRAIVPEQSIKDGVARISVVEGYVSDIRIDGDDYASLMAKDRTGVIDRFTRLVTGMRPFNIDTMQNQLLLMNDNGYAASSVVFAPLPATNAPVGAVGMSLTLQKRSPLWTIGINSYSSNYLGPYHATLGFSTGNILTSWDQLDIAAETSVPHDRVRSISSTYSFPIPINGTRAYIGTSLSTMAPGYKLTKLDVDGGSEKLFFGISHSLLRSREAYASINAEGQISNSRVSVLGATLYSDRVRKVSVSANGGIYDSLKGLNEANISLSQGLEFGSKGEGDPNISRGDGDATFTVLSGSYARTQSVTPSVESLLRFSGQYSATPLLASEEFGFGGSSLGRAFDPSEFTGDKGISALIEMRYMSLHTTEMVKTIPFVYYDAAKIWNYNLDNSTIFASSAGFGLKFLSDYGIVGDVTMAWPLANEQGAPRWGNGKSPRLLLGVSYQF